MSSIGVFAGFSAGHDPHYRAAARELGALIGQGGHRLIYGGGSGGLMGEVADAVLAAGGSALGVVPLFLLARDPAAHTRPHPVMPAADLFERKRLMISASDAFIALPGGLGTLDEVLDVLAMRALGTLDAPLSLLDTAGAWQSLLALSADLHERGFTRREAGFQVAATPAEALAQILGGGRC
jgi:uncharacterized protein (TIGR00730 family)